ncbi:hypothetical protein RRG08_051771 [Elysia crispata]|uniref:Uncharacterized protein n=1 Tax=Elysia crispata TaxID=231223 RepID=A0AAE1EBF4_9GAST|nr:hypothetical protein RRG08_051771 [Elysia crispata]
MVEKGREDTEKGKMICQLSLGHMESRLDHKLRRTERAAHIKVGHVWLGNWKSARKQKPAIPRESKKDLQSCVLSASTGVMANWRPIHTNRAAVDEGLLKLLL